MSSLQALSRPQSPAAAAAAADLVRRDDAALVPVGGSVGQFLRKSGAGDFSMAWADASGGGLGGIVDCSAMTTVSQINTASLAAPDGSIIWLGRRPPSTPLVQDDTLIYRPRQKLLGAGGRDQLTCLQAGPSFPAGKPLVAAQGYMGNGTSADSPVAIVGVHLDVNNKAGSHGLVVYNFWSHFEDIQVAGCNGPGAHGFHVTDRGVDGVTVSENSHSENTFQRLRFDAFIGKASMFWAENTNGLGNSNQDGHLKDSFFASNGADSGYGVRIGRAAGWSIENCHFYGIGYDAINLTNCYATKVIGNYVEDFGGDDGANNGQDPTYGYYSGIVLGSVLNTRASVVMGNTVSVHQPLSPTGNRWSCYSVRAGSGQTLANVVMVGNTAVWALDSLAGLSPNRSYAYWLGEGGDSGRMLYVEWAANQIQSALAWAGTRNVAASTVTITEPGSGGSGVPTSRSISAGTGLAGGGDLSADRSFAVSYGTAAGTAAQGNDSRITGAAVDTSVVHLAGTETITGAKTFNTAPQVPVGGLLANPVRRDDARLTDARTPVAHAASHRSDGADPINPAPRTVTFSATPTVAAVSGVDLDRVNITATANITSLALSGGDDGQKVEVAVLGSSGTRTVTIASAVDVSTGLTRGAYSVASTKLGIFLFRYSTLNNKWSLIAATVTA